MCAASTSKTSSGADCAARAGRGLLSHKLSLISCAGCSHTSSHCWAPLLPPKENFPMIAISNPSCLLFASCSLRLHSTRARHA